MRRAFLWIGVLLALGAGALFAQRWIVEPVKQGRSEQSRGWSEGRRGGDAGQRAVQRRNRGPNSLQVFEVVIDVLNVVVGVVGIWLAILGMRLHRANATGRDSYPTSHPGSRPN